MFSQTFVLRAPSLDGVAESPSTADNALPREQQDRLRNLATLLQYPRSQRVYSQGEETRFIYFISSGLIRVFRSTEDGRRQIVSFRGPGDLCGLPQSGLYANSADTISCSMVYRLSWELFHQLILTTPHLQMIMLKKVASEFHEAQAHIMMLGQQNIFHRVATFLVEMMEVSQFFDARQSLLYLPMNRFDVADYLGTSSETAGRAFTKLENMGIIRRVSARRIEILDADRLRLVQRGPRRNNNQCEQRPADIQMNGNTRAQDRALPAENKKLVLS